MKINPDVYWQVTAPAIADGKVVFTAPDEKDIHCVNLRDGSRVWSAARDNDDLYMAGVFNGKVVIVGKNRTRALSLGQGRGAVAARDRQAVRPGGRQHARRRRRRAVLPADPRVGRDPRAGRSAPSTSTRASSTPTPARASARCPAT